MNIIWILTDGICTYERSGDMFSILPTYQTLRKECEGFYFENAISQFGSTMFSLLSMFTGRFPYYIFPDFYKEAEPLPELKNAHFLQYLAQNNWNIHSVLMWQEGVNVFRDMLNPYFKEGMFVGDRMLEAKEVYGHFVNLVEELDTTTDNFLFVHYRPADANMETYIQKTIQYLKESHLWEDSIIILSADHGYTDNWKWYKRMNLLHFDDLYHSTLSVPLYIKFPSSLTLTPPRVIQERVYLLDIMETILDYLDLSPSHERDARSFKPVIEQHIDVNKERIVRSDCYLMFQPLQKTAILKGDWNLFNDYGKFHLFDLNEDKLEYIPKKGKILKIPPRIDHKSQYPEVYQELLSFYNQTEEKALSIVKNYVGFLMEKKEIAAIRNQKVFIPHQFPPQLVLLLQEALKRENEIITEDQLHNLKDYPPQSLITILIFNRLTGYGLKKLIKKYSRVSQKVIVVNTKLDDAQENLSQLGYWKFVKRTFKARDRQIFQRMREVITFIFYFPALLNKYLKKSYR